MAVHHSDSHVHFDLWVGGVATDAKVFKLEIVNVLDLVSSDDLKSGKGAWLSSKLRDEQWLHFIMV